MSPNKKHQNPVQQDNSAQFILYVKQNLRVDRFFDPILKAKSALTMSEGRPDPIVKAAESTKLPREIRNRLGMATDPVPEGMVLDVKPKCAGELYGFWELPDRPAAAQERGMGLGRGQGTVPTFSPQKCAGAEQAVPARPATTARHHFEIKPEHHDGDKPPSDEGPYTNEQRTDYEKASPTVFWGGRGGGRDAGEHERPGGTRGSMSGREERGGA